MHLPISYSQRFSCQIHLLREPVACLRTLREFVVHRPCLQKPPTSPRVFSLCKGATNLSAQTEKRRSITTTDRHTLSLREEKQNNHKTNRIQANEQHIKPPRHPHHRHRRHLREQHVERPVRTGRRARPDGARARREDLRGEHPRHGPEGEREVDGGEEDHCYACALGC